MKKKTTRNEAKKKLEKLTGVKIDSKDFTYIVKVKQKDGTEKEIEKVSIDKVVDYLMEKYTFKTIYGEKFENVYLYRNGIYILKGKAIIKTQVEKELKNKSTTHIVNEIFEKVKRKTEIDIEEFNEIKEGLICLENGIYDLDKKKFLNHNPKYYFKSKLPIFYDPKADCPNIKKFFEEILYPEDVKVMQEWFGFNPYNKYFEKKAMILFGDTNTGKTITLDLLSAFIGENNTTSLSLQDISHGKTFDLLDLKDKYSNIYDDLGDKDINDVGKFKIATGGSSITGEKKFGDRVKFKTYAKLSYATNKIPAIKDVDDDAYYIRWMPIRLDNQIPKKNQDNFLIKKLTTKEELSGCFNWAVKGLDRLFQNKRFSFNKSAKEIKEIMQRSSHHLVKFAQDCLIEETGNRISKELMFQIYLEWCKKNDVSNFTKDKLGKNLGRFVSGLNSEGGKERVWINFKFSEVPLRYDSHDTFLKNMRDKKSSNKEGDIFLKYNKIKGVIPVTKKKEENDSYDIFNEKEDKIIHEKITKKGVEKLK